MRILGIDPGSNRIGICIMDKDEALEVVYAGVIEIKSSESEKRITEIVKRFETILKKYKPKAAALESLYFAKNKKTAMRVAESIGILKYLLVKSRIRYIEMSPPEIKAAVTGYGGSDKKGVQKMVKMILKIDELKGPDDIADAIAVAIASSFRFK